MSRMKALLLLWSVCRCASSSYRCNECLVLVLRKTEVSYCVDILVAHFLTQDVWGFKVSMDNIWFMNAEKGDAYHGENSFYFRLLQLLDRFEVSVQTWIILLHNKTGSAKFIFDHINQWNNQNMVKFIQYLDFLAHSFCFRSKSVKLIR